MKKGLLAVLLALAVVTATGPAASAVTINFDTGPGGAIADGTIINTLFAGVTFSCIGSSCTGTNIYARSAINAPSAPNVVSIFGSGLPFTHDGHGVIQATFDTPTTFVSIDAISIESPEGFVFSDKAYLKAFNSSGTLISTVTNTTNEVFQTLSITAADIKFVQLGATRSSGSPVFGEFDNLTFGVTAPEPSSLALVGLGLAGLAAAAHRRARRR